MSLVLDSSATLAWIYSDETTERIRRLFDAVADDGAVVPALWRLEVANSLTVAVRRGRIDADFRRAALVDLALLDITTDDQTGSGLDTFEIGLDLSGRVQSFWSTNLLISASTDESNFSAPAEDDVGAFIRFSGNGIGFFS